MAKDRNRKQETLQILPAGALGTEYEGAELQD